MNFLTWSAQNKLSAREIYSQSFIDCGDHTIEYCAFHTYPNDTGNVTYERRIYRVVRDKISCFYFAIDGQVLTFNHRAPLIVPENAIIYEMKRKVLETFQKA